MAEQLCNDAQCSRNRDGEPHPAHDMTEEIKVRSESANSLIEAGTDITGSAIGAIAGALVAGPPGAIAGSILGPVFSHTFRNIGHEIRQRMLSPRENTRIGAVFTYALAKIDENIKNGRKLRTDNFINDEPEQRSGAQEIIEGVLLHAQSEYEEKKLKFYGNLLANIAFEPSVDRPIANQLLKLANRLSYRQLCILALVGQKKKFVLRDYDYREETEFSTELYSILQEFYDMYNQALVGTEENAMISAFDLNPSMMSFGPMGSMLYLLMELDKIEEVKHLANVLGLSKK